MGIKCVSFFSTMFSGNIFCCDRYLVSDSSDAGRNADLKKKRLWVKFVNHNYIHILCADFLIWIDSEKLTEFHVMFFQSAYIWLIQTKLVLTDNRPTKFHQSLSNFGNETNKTDSNYMPIILSFHGLQEHVILKLCTMHKLCKINSLTSVANNNTMAVPIWDVLNW